MNNDEASKLMQKYEEASIKSNISQLSPNIYTNQIPNVKSPALEEMEKTLTQTYHNKI